jgi:ribosomal protein S18 acetylase RimI-like enzyme
VQSAAQVEVSDESDYDIWADAMCRSFDLPRAMGDVGRRVLFVPEVRCYLARVNGVPAGTTLLYSQFGMGYIDLVGTLPEYRHQGVASALLTQAVSDSQSLGNRWTTLESTTGSNAVRLYEKFGFRTAYNRQRYTMCHA